MLRAFHLEYPNILLTCYRCDTDRLAAGLFNNEYDIIFTWDSTNILQEHAISHKIIERASGGGPSQRTSLRPALCP